MAHDDRSRHDHGHPGHQHGHQYGHEHAGHAHDHTQAPGGRDWAEFGGRLEREGEFVRPLHDELVDSIRAALGVHPVRRVLDLGSGPGVATTLLAEAFPAARATAADASAPLLELAAARADRLGLSDRVETQLVDLEGSLDVLVADGPADVVWASMVLHHVDGLAHTLARIRDLLAPGGVLALVEFGHDHRASRPARSPNGRVSPSVTGGSSAMRSRVICHPARCSSTGLRC